MEMIRISSARRADSEYLREVRLEAVQSLVPVTLAAFTLLVVVGIRGSVLESWLPAGMLAATISATWSLRAHSRTAGVSLVGGLFASIAAYAYVHPDKPAYVLLPIVIAVAGFVLGPAAVPAAAAKVWPERSGV